MVYNAIALCKVKVNIAERPFLRAESLLLDDVRHIQVKWVILIKNCGLRHAIREYCVRNQALEDNFRPQGHRQPG